MDKIRHASKEDLVKLGLPLGCVLNLKEGGAQPVRNFLPLRSTHDECIKRLQQHIVYRVPGPRTPHCPCDAFSVGRDDSEEGLLCSSAHLGQQDTLMLQGW